MKTLIFLLLSSQAYSQSLKKSIKREADNIFMNVDISNASREDLYRVKRLLKRSNKILLGQSDDELYGNTLSLYRSDDCSSELIANVRNQTVCKELGRSSAYAVKINNKCIDIKDMSVEKACSNFKEVTKSYSYISFYQSDKCKDDLLAVSTPNTTCSLLGQNRAYAVSINNTCYDISDTELSKACSSFKALSDGGQKLKIFSSDDCQSDSLEAVTSRKTNCIELQNKNRKAYAIQKSNGSCEDIKDTSVINACKLFSY